MSTLNMDPQQLDAVNSCGKNILVSASAGAGKTRVLVERLIKRCIKDRIPLDRILAVTFTQAAAGEMKNRTAARLMEELRDVKDDDQKQWIESQLILIDSAPITTIDSFCLTIIEKYCSVIGLDPAATQHVLDDGEHARILLDSYHAVLDRYDQDHHEALLDALCAYSARSEDYDTLLDILNKIMSHADSSANPAEWFAHARSASAEIQRLDQLPAGILDGFWNSLNLEFSGVEEALAQMFQEAQKSDKLSDPKQAVKLEGVSILVQNCRKLLDEHNYAMFRSVFFSFGEQKTPTDSKCESYTKARSRLYETAGKLARKLYDPFLLISDHNRNVPLIHTYLDLAELTRNEFLHKKKDLACMDFADMERFALEILQKNDCAVSLLYQQKFDEVMVDEFQDTSILQNEIIELLAKPGTIFRVGDVKQSIYRFRQAKPELMRSMLDDPDMLNITLEHNYRSKENIVSFCNLLFERLMNVPVCMDRYGSKDKVSIGTDKQKLKTPTPVRFVLVDTGPAPDHQAQPDPDSGDIPTESLGSKEAKAAYIASEILRLVREENCSFQDMAVLVRSHHDKPILRQVFDKCHIPYDIDAREGFYHSILCETILAVLKCMLDPTDTVSMCTVLTSPIGDLSDSTLAEMKIAFGSLSKGVKADHPEFFEQLNSYRSICRTDGLCALLDAIAMTNHFYESLDSTQKSNFDYLFEKTVKLEQSSRSIYDLIELMDAPEDENSSEAMSRSRDDEVVNVTTIHQSKGLQYKNVFLFSTSLSVNQETKSPVMVDDDLYLGLKHVDFPYRTVRTTIDRIAVEYKDNREDLEEFTRLLYVALTRAEERLYIVDTGSELPQPSANITLSLLARRKGMSGLIKAALGPVRDLFTPSVIKLDSITPEAPLPAKHVSSLPYYNGKAEILSPSHTPSAFELTSLPDLDLNQAENGTRYGTLMHETLAALPNRLWTMEDLKDTELSDTDKEKILNFSSSDLYHEALNMEIHHEYPFYLEDHGARMHGVMDFVAIGEKGILLIDYKTDSASEAEIKHRYSDQLNAYRHALQFIFKGKPVTCYAWSLHSSSAILIPDQK
ncbi:MAG: UvrD-helicase domain-containing protein [Solobacterium sp.]|nr:UvrD-helicase domain-containing protein [Solobacterium sp.]MCH4223152.1 UvrD-helicase domain-containing protein [Solobacterium sp.]MCH4266577.1 UvrD-helicase domain-containing protein [Solobacterium sp.]